jgi:hypothetical protein
MKWWHNFLCRIGIHNWRQLKVPFPQTPIRVCMWCDKIQVLKFYSNHAQEWVDK